MTAYRDRHLAGVYTPSKPTAKRELAPKKKAAKRKAPTTKGG